MSTRKQAQSSPSASPDKHKRPKSVQSSLANAWVQNSSKTRASRDARFNERPAMMEVSPMTPPIQLTADVHMEIVEENARAIPNTPTNPQDLRMTNNNAGTSTPPRSNRRNLIDTRYELKLTIPASTPDNAYQILKDTLGKILSKIWDSDKNAKILPRYNNSQAQPLNTVSDIPNMVSSLRQFFPRLTPNTKGGIRFTNI